MKLSQFSVRLCILLLIYCLAGCGSDETTQEVSAPVAAEKPVQVQQTNTDDITTAVATATDQHQDNALALYAAGLSNDNPAEIFTAIDQLEQACLKNPGNNLCWIDLADAYFYSDNLLQYPYAIELYWMLYHEAETDSNLLLARLVEAYQKIGNPQAAFDVATERLRQATATEIQNSALQLTWLAVENDRYQETAELLSTTATSSDNAEFLQLLAASLHELNGDDDSARKAIDQALANLTADTPLFKLAQQVRGRLAQ